MAKSPRESKKGPSHQSIEPTAIGRAVRRALFASAVSSMAIPAVAQDIQGPIEEIIVTTERREQSLQDVAATVQAFNGEELLRLGVNSEFANLQHAVPGLQIAKQEGKLEVFLRGIGSSDSDFSSDPSVATHYNGVYLARPRGIGPLFFDSERVEINKGPQGTLRGRNATGGTINIISNKPDFGSVNGYVQGGVGNFDGRELSGVLNIPFTDTFAGRFSVWSRSRDGLYTNAFGFTSDGFKTPSSQDDVAYRASLRWEPSEATTVDLQYFKAEVQSSGDPGAFSGRSLSAGFDVSDLSDPWDQYFRTGGNFEQDVDTALLQVSHDFGGTGIEYNGSFNELSAYNQNASREWQLGMNFPGSEAEADFIASGANPQRNLLVNDTFYQADKSDSYSNEIRLYGTGAGRLQWTAGIFQFHEDFDYLSWDVGNGFCGDSSSFVGVDSPVGPNTISCWQNGLGGENRGDDSEVDSLAFYADATYDVTDTVSVKAGIRYTDEEKNQRDSNAQYQFNFNQDFFFSQPGINVPSDLIIGEPGFRLTNAADRSIRDLAPGDSTLNFFQDGIASYGSGDNWGQVLDACVEGVDCEVIVTSIFDPNGDRNSVRADNSVEDDYVDWRLGLEYNLSGDNFVYGTVSTGTRSGGINRPLILADGRQLNTTWNPEELVVYEFGSKNTLDLGGNPTRLNAALFYYDYNDYVAQVLVDVPNPTPMNPDATTQQVLTDNVSDAEILGLEIEGNIALGAGFDINASLLYLDSSFENSAILDPRTNNNNVINIDGNDLPNVSDWNLNLRLSQVIPFDSNKVQSFDWTVNAMYRSEYFLTPFNNKGYELDMNGNTVEIPLSQMPPPNNNTALSDVGGAAGPGFFADVVDDATIVNANAGLNFGEAEEFRVDLFVENVFEEAYSTKAFVNSSVNIRYLNSPRIYGLRFRAFFD